MEDSMNRILISTVVMLLGLAVTAVQAEIATAHVEDVRPGMAENLKIKGDVVLTDTMQGLRVSGTLVNLPAGNHGFHIHEFGSCVNKADAAGSHYNPGTMP